MLYRQSAFGLQVEPLLDPVQLDARRTDFGLADRPRGFDTDNDTLIDVDQEMSE